MTDHAHRLYCTNLHHGLREGDCLECDLMNERARAEAAEAERDAERDEALARLRVVGDDYEAANLRAGLLTLRKLGLDTGDWLGQIEQRLPYVDQVPNRSVEDQVAQVNARAEAAEAERDEARRDWQMYVHEIEDEKARAEAAEARVTELEAALREIADTEWFGNGRRIARAALAKEDTDE